MHNCYGCTSCSSGAGVTLVAWAAASRRRLVCIMRKKTRGGVREILQQSAASDNSGVECGEFHRSPLRNIPRNCHGNSWGPSVVVASRS